MNINVYLFDLYKSAFKKKMSFIYLQGDKNKSNINLLR